MSLSDLTPIGQFVSVDELRSLTNISGKMALERAVAELRGAYGEAESGPLYSRYRARARTLRGNEVFEEVDLAVVGHLMQTGQYVRTDMSDPARQQHVKEEVTRTGQAANGAVERLVRQSGLASEFPRR